MTKKEIIKKAIEDRFSFCPQYIINYLVEYYIESLGRDCACEMIEKSPYLCMDCISVLQGEIFRIQRKEKECGAEIEALKHRAEVAEEALRELIAEMYENGIRPICNQEMLYETRLEQAEARLSELKEVEKC